MRAWRAIAQSAVSSLLFSSASSRVASPPSARNASASPAVTAANESAAEAARSASAFGWPVARQVLVVGEEGPPTVGMFILYYMYN